MQNFWTLNEFIKNAVRQKVVETEMFNVDLQTFMDIQKHHMKFLNVPWVVRLCSDDMIRRGLILEGLFRVPGSHNIVSSICEAARYGLVPDFDQDGCNLEEVSGVFKKYIRELPHPLFIDDEPKSTFHSEFAKVMELSSVDDQIVTLNKLIKQLTPCRRALTKEIFLIFFLVSLESEINFMSSLNLGTIFGGMVDIISNTMFSDEKKRLCTFLIDNYPKIFHDIDILKKEPEITLTEEEKAAKSILTVFLDDGTFRTFWGVGGDTALSVRESLIKKMQQTSEKEINVNKYRIYEIRDREVRMLDDDEYIVPLLKLSKTLLCSNKFNPNEISIPWHISLANKRADQFLDSRQAYLDWDQIDENEMMMSGGLRSCESTPRLESLVLEEAAARQALETEEEEIKKMQLRHRELQEKQQVEIVSTVVQSASPEVLEKIKILNEKFVKDEEEYLNNLKILNKFYITPFKQFKEKEISTDEINLIFYPALSGLLGLHEQISSKLTSDNIPHTLLSVILYFKMYAQICSNQDLSLDTARKLSKEPKFQSFVAKCKKESKCETELIDLLELPGKRTQRYQDQILEIINTSKGEPIPFATHIKEVYVELTRINSENAEQSEVSKTRAVILQLLERVDVTTFPGNFELMLPTRRFVKEGEGTVKIDSTVLGNYSIILFNDIIMINTVPPKEKKNKLKIKTKKEPKDEIKGTFYMNIDLKTVNNVKLVTNDSDIIGQLLSFESLQGNEKQKYYFHVKDPQQWIFLINGSIEVILSIEKEKQDILSKSVVSLKKLNVAKTPEKNKVEILSPKSDPKPKEKASVRKQRAKSVTLENMKKPSTDKGINLVSTMDLEDPSSKDHRPKTKREKSFSSTDSTIARGIQISDIPQSARQLGSSDADPIKTKSPQSARERTKTDEPLKKSSKHSGEQTDRGDRSKVVLSPVSIVVDVNAEKQIVESEKTEPNSEQI